MAKRTPAPITCWTRWKPRNLKAAFQQIFNMLRASYDLAYTSTQPMAEAGFRKLRICSKIPDLNFRRKTGYYARPS